MSAGPVPTGELTRVLIAGAGVAGLETMLALSHLAPGRFDIQLVAPTRRFAYHPLAVGEPFGLSEAHQLDLGKLVRYRGAIHHRDAIAEVEPERRRALTAAGATLAYDWLVVAIGTRAIAELAGALTFDGADGPAGFRPILDDLAAGTARSIVFAVPPEGRWPLPIYELALLTAAFLFEHRVGGARLEIVTPEAAPLDLFGTSASRSIRRLLADQGIGLRTGTNAVEVQPGGLVLDASQTIAADRVVTLPRLEPARVRGLPQDDRGFVHTDTHGRVPGVDRIYAAGDVTSYPVKQGGLAAQQADAVAEAIAASEGVALRPTPFSPTLRGVLMTGDRPRYLRADRTRDHREFSAADHALWWPPGKIAAKHLTPYLAARAGVGLPRPPARTSVPVSAELPAAAVAPISVTDECEKLP